jgi:hypothetical protein
MTALPLAGASRRPPFADDTTASDGGCRTNGSVRPGYTVFGSPFGYQSPPYSDSCLDQGGLDLNIYGAWVTRSGHDGGR